MQQPAVDPGTSSPSIGKLFESNKALPGTPSPRSSRPSAAVCGLMNSTPRERRVPPLPACPGWAPGRR
eukprot:1876762-Alexandrium_andersonii.AAC.1